MENIPAIASVVLLIAGSADEIPLVAWVIPIAGMAMVLGIVAIVFWYKARERELQVHQDMRIREMEHQRRMKELELEIEKTRSRQASEKVV